MSSISPEFRMMHVLPNFEVGGTQKIALDLADSLPEIETSFAAVYAGGAWENEFRSRGSTTILRNEDGNPHRSYSWFNPRLIGKLANAMWQNSPDIVQTHTFPAATVGRAAAKLSGTPVIIDTLHNTYSWKESSDLRIDRFLARWTDCIACDSGGVLDYALRQNPKIQANKYRRMYLGIDTDRYKHRDNSLETRLRFDLLPEHFVVGAMGRLVHQKRMIDLIQAAPKVIDRVSNARFLIVGEGPLGEHLSEEVRRLGIEHAVRFAGTVNDNENIYPACDIFAQLADREGFGLSMVEAMASRTPLIAAAGEGSVKEITQHDKNALVYEVGDVDKLAEHILALHANPKHRMALALCAEQDARSRFDLKTSSLNHKALYKELLSSKEA